VEPQRRLFVALDTPEPDEARRWAERLAGHVGGFKIGLELFSRGGPQIVRDLAAHDADLFVDLKLHDIPNTVAGAAKAVTALGASFFTVHASGGSAMIRAAVEASASAADAAGRPHPTVLAVTVLTSLDDAALEQIGLDGPCRPAVLRLAELARKAGAGGIVCSPLEVAEVRPRFPDGTLVVPGIRPAGGAPRDDQRRVATPAQAVARGADRLVIGRPITRADDPAAAARAITAEIAAGA
jgi:orotidine-5'-phosphate decarboxylase